LILTPVGTNAYTLGETDPNFSPDGLVLEPVTALANDITMIGEIETQAYV
jgi:hypothetical protein